jgi:O-Antigen ligase
MYGAPRFFVYMTPPTFVDGLNDPAAPSTALPADRSGQRRRSRRGETPRRLLARRAAAFAISAFLVLVLAFNGGGYDVVIRHQVGLAIWAAIALGLGVGILPRARLTPAAWVAIGGFAALAALTLLSHVWTESDERTTEELARVLEYAGVVTLAFLSLNRYTWRGAAMGFAAAALVLPFFALTARLFPQLITDHLATGHEADRLSYPFNYWNGVSCWGAMAVAIGLTLSANASRFETRAVALACVPAAALSIYLSYSRFGAAAVAIAVVAAVCFSRGRWTAVANAIVAGAGAAVAILVARGHPEIAHATGNAGAGAVAVTVIAVGIVCGVTAAITQRAGLDRVRMDVGSARLALGAGVIGALLLAVALHGPIGNAWGDFKNEKPPPSAGGTVRFTSLGSARYDVWTAAVDAFKAHPLDGVGPGAFEFYWSRHGKQEFVRDAHTLYLEQAAELGLPGVIAVLVALGGLLAAAIQARKRWRRRREMAAGSALIAAFVVFLAYAGIDWMWELGAIGTLAVGGIAVAAAGGFERYGAAPLRPWMRGALVVLALAAAISQIPGLVSTERVRASQAKLAAGDLVRARTLADDAIDAEPWAGTPYAARAMVLESAGDLAGARSDAQSAIDRDPYNWRDNLLLARIDARRGDRSGVDAQLGDARRLAPHSPYLNPASPFRRQIDALLARNAAGSARARR